MDVVTMDVAPISAVASADPANAVSTIQAAGQNTSAEAFATVNLGAMIASRLNGATSTSTGATIGLGLDQAPGILRAATRTDRLDAGAGALDVPAALQAYGNGRIPKELLTPIGIGQHRLWSVAAQAFTTMRAAAAADGVEIGVTDSYRSYDQQVELAARKGLWKDGGYAAVPGTSPHGWGLALDVDVTPKGLEWLRANGGRFGFVETTPREPWHWEFRGAT